MPAKRRSRFYMPRKAKSTTMPLFCRIIWRLVLKWQTPISNVKKKGSYRNTTPSNDCLPYENLRSEGCSLELRRGFVPCPFSLVPFAGDRSTRGGRGRIRTVVGGFADPYLTT